MNSYTRRRLLASAKLGLTAIPFMVAIQLAQGHALVPGTFLYGFGAGFIVGIAELFVLKNWLKSLPFFLHLLIKSGAILLTLYLTFVVLNLLDVVIDGISWEAYLRAILDPKTLAGLLEYFALILFLLFFVKLDRLLGPGVLLGYITGRYHRPRRENRIFMFLDLKGSTNLADQMTADRYFSFLHRYFAEMSEPILATNAEIYQYVGDEVVLTWRMAGGLEEANCLRVFFLIEDRIQAQREHFLREYGAVPEFKAGVHFGEVISAQIGELKTEIVYNGDVLNVAARIQSLCNSYGQKLLISRELMEALSIGSDYEVTELGPVPLRGKTEAFDLFAVRRSSAP